MVLRPGRQAHRQMGRRLRFGGLGAVLLSYLRDYVGPEGLRTANSWIFFLATLPLVRSTFVLVMLTEEVESQNNPMSGFVNLGL